MNLRTPTWVAAAAFTAGLAAPTPFQKTETLEQRVEKLERELEELKAANAKAADAGERVTVVEEYLQTLGRAAQESAKTLDRAMALGFTHGINPEAKEAVVESVRSLSEAAKSKVPGVPDTGPHGPDPRRSRFQRDQ